MLIRRYHSIGMLKSARIKLFYQTSLHLARVHGSTDVLDNIGTGKMDGKGIK